MNLDIPTCKVCYEAFNLDSRLPRLFPECGHTFCSSCLSTMLNSEDELRCPEDRRTINKADKTLTSFPVNYMLLEIIERQLSEDALCQQHHEKKMYVCLTDKKTICGECLITGEKVGQKFKSLNQVQAQIRKKVARMEEVEDQLTEQYQKAVNAIRKVGNSLTKTLEYRFIELRNMLFRKESLLLHDIRNYTDTQEGVLSKKFGINSAARRQLAEKITAYKHPSKDSNIVSMLEENLEKFLLQVLPPEDFETCLQELEHSLNLTIDSWNASLLQQQTQLLSCFNLSLEKISATAIHTSMIHDEISESDKMDTEVQRGVLTFTTSLELAMTQDTLRIVISDKEPIIQNINISDFLCTKAVLLEMNNQNLITYEDAALLQHAWNSIKTISSFSFTCKSSSMPTYILQDLLYDLFPTVHTIMVLNLDISTCKGSGNNSIRWFVEDLLPRMIKLEELELNLDGVGITDDTLISFAENNASIAQGLHIFSLDLSFNEKITDKGLKAIFVPIPSIITYRLFLMATKFTDESIFALAQYLIPYSKIIQSFNLDFRQTDISNKPIFELLNTLSNIKDLAIHLNTRCIQEETMKALGQIYLPQFVHLDDLTMTFEDHCMNDDLIAHIIVPLPCLQKLDIYLRNQKITNKTLQLLKECLLQNEKPLQSLTLDLSNTDITEKGALELLEPFYCLTYLGLDLEKTRLSDTFVKELVDRILPKMKLLKDLDVKMKETDVNKEMVDKLEEYRGKASTDKKLNDSREQG